MKTVLKNCNRALSWCFYLASPKVTTYKEGQSFFSFFTRLSSLHCAVLSLVFARLHGLEAARKLGEIKVIGVEMFNTVFINLVRYRFVFKTGITVVTKLK